MSRFMRSMLLATGVCALVMCGFQVQAQQYGDPQDTPQSYDQPQPANADQSPGRVARLAYLSGQVQFAPAGEDNWGTVDVNRPMVIGDRLLTGDDGLAVLELGDASVRIDHDTAFDFLNLDENNVQVELSQGTLNLAVRQLGQGENFEVDTPTVAFVASAPGSYRIDDDPSGTGSMVTVFQGSGTVYGENGVSRDVVAGTSYRFNDSALTSVEENGLPQPDDFDRFCEARDANYARYAQQQQQYVPPDMIGGDELNQYGQWSAVPDYGNVWYPNAVPVGWAPYRYGHWAWIDPWGWTWVDDEPWGFAPFHYGRWAYISNRWGWIPGPVDVQPVYAPALVAFIGGAGFSLSIGIGGGGPVGWFPLGPRDVYVPWFHASRQYFTNVNVTNIRNVYVNRTVINNYYADYQAGRAPPRGGNAYAYHDLPQAVTAVPRNVFTGARPVHAAALKLNRTQLARTEVAVRPAVTPAVASLALRRPTAHPAVLKGRQPFTRPVVARHAPPPRPVSFAAREKVIASQHGQPLTAAQMQDLRKAQPAPAARSERVKVVPAVAHAAPARPAEPPRRTGPTQAPFKNTVHPIPARNQPAQRPTRPGELPSARFAHPAQRETLPRAPATRPAGEPQRNAPSSGRLPEVKRVEPASQAAQNQAAQRQRESAASQQRAAQSQAQQRAAQERTREQQVQQQRRAAQQAQSERQAQERHQAEAQASQRARAQQAQQRQAEAQAQQRAREQAMQQQREMQQRQMEQQRAMQEQRAMQQQRQMEQQRAVQAQQRAAAMQRERAAEQRGRPAPERRPPPPKKRPPPSSSSGGGFR
ncbi:MAG TPA: DUF6600 domain-containing protein [Rhodanobacteraceae bacterium]|nr:DUF6600 domain-containing protein [Rhodanobacteraceae bacterium]